MTWLTVLGVAMLAYLAVMNLAYVTMTAISARDLSRYRRRMLLRSGQEDMLSPLTPGISVVMPAYNEQAGIRPAALSLLSLRYPAHEVLIVNDGSTDDTMSILIETFDLFEVRRVLRTAIPYETVRAVYASRQHPNLFVIDKDNGGKADAMNAGISIAAHPYVCVVDADALLEEDALLSVAKPLIDHPDDVAATGGIVRIINGCQVRHGCVTAVGLPRNRLAVLQVVEYFRAFLVGRVAFSKIGGLLIISGAFGVFRRELVEEVGGFWTDTVGEDMEMVIRLHRHLAEQGRKDRIEFVASPVSWTECPEDWKVLSRQRKRWQRGLAQTLWRHRQMVGRRRYGIVGCLSLPYFWLFELLGPVLTSIGYLTVPVLWAWGMVSIPYAIAFYVLSVLSGVLLSVSALALEEWSFRRHPRGRDVARMMLWSVLENFGYRQINDLLRVWALGEQLAGRQASWGVMTRKGLGTPEPDPPAS